MTVIIYTRDVWMHTVDIARAIGRPVDVTHPVNRRIVGDVVVEWVGRHGHSVDLILTGPAGGHYRTGSDPGHDPIEYEPTTPSGSAESCPGAQPEQGSWPPASFSEDAGLYDLAWVRALAGVVGPWCRGTGWCSGPGVRRCARR